MKHLGTKTLETSRLILRPFTVEDTKSMYRNWAADPEVTKYLTWPAHSGVDITKIVIADWVSHYEENDYYHWAIVSKDSKQVIGSIGVVSMHKNTKCVQIGYCLGKPWWHQGIMAEALDQLIAFFFDEIGANRLECCHDINNTASGAVMRKCGMHYEGTLRQSGWNNQGICDVCWYSILASDRKRGRA